MRARMVACILLTTAGAAHAVQPVHPPGLLPTAIARALLEQDPRVLAAREGLEIGRQDAAILEKSPYEWTAKLGNQRRTLENGPHYREWNAGVERTIRLPGKAAADRNIGTATVEQAEARYGEALHESARALLMYWVDWLAAERGRELITTGLKSSQDSLAAVEIRIQAGDASKLDLGIARSELAEQRRLENDAKTQASAAWARLSAHYPGLPRDVTPLPPPLRISEDAQSWQDRVLAESEDLKVVQTQLRLAQGQAERARADRLPDPTIGFYTASEIGGRERISGFTVSIPIPGNVRDARSNRAAAAANVSRQEIESKKRQLVAEINSAVATARGAYDSLQIANEGASAMGGNATLMQRAYALGEAELQALLQARRQANAAATNALQSHVTALKAYYSLLVDAHLIWDLERD